MKVGDLVKHNKVIGVITYVFDNNDLCVLFKDGEFQVDSRDCVVISEEPS